MNTSIHLLEIFSLTMSDNETYSSSVEPFVNILIDVDEIPSDIDSI